MAVGDFFFPSMHPVDGLELGVAEAGIRYPSRKDLVLIKLCPGTRVAGLFTQNAFSAAPVKVAKKHLSQGDPRFLVINTGNANACTGDQGMTDCLATCARVAELGDCDLEQVLPFSTGVIGELLPMEPLLQGIKPALENLKKDNWKDAAEGILTTDTRSKGASEQVQCIYTDDQGKEQYVQITVSGMAKGSGMIKPNMATMLAFIATDAKVSQEVLEELSRRATAASFNRITVDGDTSTNDACLLMATGTSHLPEIDRVDSEACRTLEEALVRVYQQLAKAIVADGEGATKFVTVEVSGAKNVEEASSVAYSVAQSPLVKTALFASDPNWGRVVAAIGNAGIQGLETDLINVHLNNVVIVEQGGIAPGYTEAMGQEVMAGEEITIDINLRRGSGKDWVWTTDLSYDYVRINADYRT